MVIAPPVDVSRVTEGAAHHRAGALFLLGPRVREQRHAVAKWSGHLLANEVRKAGIIWMHKDGDTGGQQFWTGGSNGQDRAILQTEGQLKKGALGGDVVE